MNSEQQSMEPTKQYGNLQIHYYHFYYFRCGTQFNVCEHQTLKSTFHKSKINVFISEH